MSYPTLPPSNLPSFLEKPLLLVSADRVCLCRRMGSFSSAPRLVNPDSQDDALQLPARISREELCRWCERQLHNTPAKLLSRRMLPVEGRPLWANGQYSTLLGKFKSKRG